MHNKRIAAADMLHPSRSADAQLAPAWLDAASTLALWFATPPARITKY
jgi:hypothetical protein